MSVDALVARVGEVLERGHALFGPATQRPTAAGASLSTAAGLARGGLRRLTASTGALPAAYRRWASDSGTSLDEAAAADRRLRSAVGVAAASDRAGHSISAAVIRSAGADIAALTPAAGTPAGQRALIQALRIRVAEQQDAIAAYSSRDARLAAALRTLAYQRGSPASRPIGMTDLSPSAIGGAGRATRASGPMSGIAAGGRPLTAWSAHAPAPMTHLPGRGTDGRVAGTPLGALTLNSTPRQVAAALIHEARRRGYSPGQTTAILADALQESHLSPRAVSPNGLWESIFQQDSSYPGRRNPNLAIAGFLDRLDTHGGPSSPDIWKSIFWLQQRPGDPSAEIAYQRGRQGYLLEIKSKHAAAQALYREIAGL